MLWARLVLDARDIGRMIVVWSLQGLPLPDILNLKLWGEKVWVN